MKMLKRWIAFCLVVLLLAGVAFNNSSLTGSQVEAADLTGDVEVLSETGESEEAAGEPVEAAEDETQTDDAGTVSEAEAQVTEQAAEPAESQETTEEAQEENGQEAVQNETSGSEAAVEAEVETEAETAVEAEAAAEEVLKELNFENDDVTITVSEVEAGAIPEGAELKVVPILEEDEETEEQYKEVEAQIQKKAEEDEKEIEGFLAYDITFTDAEGNKLEPNSEVKVTIEYKEPALPALLTTDDATETEVSVLHLEEDEDGNVKEVVDMNEAGQVDALETGSGQQVQKVEVRTESFSTFTIIWSYSSNGNYNNTSYISEPAQSALELVDNIIEKGTFDADYIGEEKVQSYTWYKASEQNGSYVEVDKINYQGGKSNLSEDGSSLYPAYDEGARQWYKVEVTLLNGSTITSEPIQVPYYDELQNGSFETPIVSEKSTNPTNMQYGNDEYAAAGGVWQSTGEVYSSYFEKNVAIEIIHEDRKGGDDGTGGYKWYPKYSFKDAAPDGAQFAELNCETAGALYQDVLTMEGEPLNYWLRHRARGNNQNNNPEYDTMYLVIMPTSEAVENELTTQKKLSEYLSEKGIDITKEYSTVGKQEYDLQNGVFVVRVTSDDQAWQYISGLNYMPTSSLTRFFFVAGRTAADGDSINPTQGNFLDDVGFSQDLPEVSDEEFTLRISKKFEGLDSTGITAVSNNIEFKITAKDQTGNTVSDNELQNLFGTTTINKDTNGVIQTPDGSLVYTLPNRVIGAEDSYTVTITEEHAELGGYTMSSEVTTVVAKNDDTTTTNSAEFILTGKTVADIQFTNTYDRSENKQVSFTKVWDDNSNEYNTRPESLNVTLVPTITVEENGELVDKELTSEELGDLEFTKTITEEDEWNTFWDVPVYYDYNGAKVKINYTVTEGDITSAYVYEAASDGAQAGDGLEYQDQFDSSNITLPDSASDASAANSVSSIAGRAMYSAAAYSADADEKSGESLGEPAHNKYVEYNKATGDYTLNLDVTGATGEANGVDILFVIDTSGSMGTGGGSQYNNLLPDVKKLLADENGIIDQIFETEGNVNSVAYVSFAGKSETTTSRWYTGTDSDISALKSNINSLKATGGTNWTYAMQKASSLLAQKSGSTNEKVVIFLSDGKPTYSMSGNSQTGNGSTTKEEYYSDAARVVSESSSLSQAQIYSVYLTPGTMEGMKEFSDMLTNSTLKNGENLETALEEILEVIIPAYSDVTITDTLSEYVDFVDNTIVVTKRSANGTETTLGEDDYNAIIAEKTITVSIKETLDDGATYTVSFRIKPSDEANEYYAENNGYPEKVVGDLGTGSTSDGKEGFYSNSTAKVTYKVNDEAGSADYPMPVVQVTTHTLTFEKEWKQPAVVESPDDSVTLDVRYSDGTRDTITLTKDENYKKTISVPVTKTISSVTETSTFTDYTPSYQISEDGTKATVINNYSKVVRQDITVKKEWIGGGSEPEIEVGLYQSINGGEAELKSRITLDSGINWTYTWDAQTIAEYEGEDTTASYTYAVREISTPAGYSSSISYEFKTNEIVATITNTYDPNCESESYYIANVLQTEQLTVDKTWDDNDDILGLRPENLDVTVQDGKGGTYTVKLMDDNSWQKTLTILKKKDTRFTATEGVISNYNQEGETSIIPTDKGVLISFVNKLQSKDIIVQKVWKDGWTVNEVDNRPGSIAFTLWYKVTEESEWEEYDTYSLTSENILYDDSGDSTNWAIKISNLPASYKYKVKEVNVAEGYWSKVTTEGDTFTITNTLKWSLKKTDMPDSGDASVLNGAEFDLKQNGQIVATGISGEDGIVTWREINENSFDQNNLNGTYTLVETKAPDGYQKLTGAEWTLNFNEGVLISATGTDEYNSYISISSKDKDNGVVVTLKNDKLYELPSTGGPGIYWYLFGGVLLMMAASLMVYKNKRGGGAGNRVK